MALKASSSKATKPSSTKEVSRSKIVSKKKSEVKTGRTGLRQRSTNSSSSLVKKEKNSLDAKKTEIAKAFSKETPQPVQPLEHLSLIEEQPVRSLQPAASKGRALPRIGAKKSEPTVVSESTPLEVAEKIMDPIQESPSEEQKVIHIKPPIMIKELAVQMNVKPFKMIHDLMEMNIFANINQSVEVDVAAKLCERYGFIFEREKQRTAGAGIHKVEPVAVLPQPPPSPKEEKPEKRVTRAPIITFMGHVDHGKTSLLDAIRRAKVASGEAGGITQHIGAYMIERNGKLITFIDTPGHAAFTAMRARGANITDIVVLVVAANDGLMPQTLEALSHAQAAKVTIIIAINKMDLPSANSDRVKRQLQEHGLVPEEWGGETICCEVSAATGAGIEHLLEMMLLQAEVLELTANPSLKARGSVIEAQVEAGRGPTATIIIQSGTLSIGDTFVCGNYWGKVKQLIDDLGKPVKKAGPSTPVKILGLSGLPNAGDELIVMEERSARQLSEERLQQLRGTKLAAPQRATLENLFQNIQGEQKKTLQIILKSDVQGSLEAITGALADIPQTKIDLKIIHAAVGPISESDVLLASASNAVIIGFGTKVENSAAAAARREGIQIKLYSIIYELIDQLREAMEGLLEPELREAIIGHATVKQVFDLTRGVVAGSMVTDGRILRTARARVLRRRQAIYDGGLATLRRFTEDVKEVRTGLECGIRLGDFTEYEPGDVIECYTLEKVAQTL
ncbi:MAG: translation initiation factor IF-2 [Chthoniobacterales bacterium]|nr:translation initiation factor IF-2 [Chthoniobacterales bacterium]